MIDLPTTDPNQAVLQDLNTGDAAGQPQQPQQPPQTPQATDSSDAYREALEATKETNRALLQELYAARAVGAGTTAVPVQSKTSVAEILGVDKNSIDLNEEERKAYQPAMDTLNKIARAAALSMVEQYHEKAAGQSTKELEARIEGVRAEMAATSASVRSTFDTQLRASVPDLSERIKDKNWSSYINQQAPFLPGVTMGNLLRTAIERGDVQQAEQIYRGFKPAQRNVNTITPGAAKTTLSTAPAAGVMYDAGAYDRLEAQFKAGKISLEAYDRAASEFIAADLEGRVVRQ